MAGQGGRGGYKLPVGCSWDSFEESAKDHGKKGYYSPGTLGQYEV